ncbi:DUF4236 domain-containing protein [Nocardia sp. MW-W600-9]
MNIGIYGRQSLNAGPFRFNLSRSGIGISAGVPGFRVGSGPRGNYVHAGAHGVYYGHRWVAHAHRPRISEQSRPGRVQLPSPWPISPARTLLSFCPPDQAI